jgi:large subunit ribosomal protein L22
VPNRSNVKHRALQAKLEGAAHYRAVHRHARMGEYKARRVIDMIRGLPVNQALDLLTHDKHRASPYVRKVLASAVANALQNEGVRPNRLVVSKAWVHGGPLLQGRLRWRSGPMGRAMPIRKRTCHIHIHVADPEVAVGAREENS